MLKNLATCKPSEFLAQSNKIRKTAEIWLNKTGVLDIRQTRPVYPDGATEEEKDKLDREQVKKNLSRMLDAILETSSQETLDLMAMLCFVEPENVDEHPMTEYIEALSALISDRAVLGFFSSLMRLGRINTSV